MRKRLVIIGLFLLMSALGMVLLRPEEVPVISPSIAVAAGGCAVYDVYPERHWNSSLGTYHHGHATAYCLSGSSSVASVALMRYGVTLAQSNYSVCGGCTRHLSTLWDSTWERQCDVYAEAWDNHGNWSRAGPTC